MLIAPFVIEDRHFEFLVVQKGSLANLRVNREKWVRAYHDLMTREFVGLVPWLPKTCKVCLDVGGGLGGVDVLINRHYGGGVQVEILDGQHDAPIVDRQDKTFNDADVTCDFLLKNGVGRFWVIASTDIDRFIWPCDLILSFGAWCFHFSPSVYLEYVKRRCRHGTVLIIDVRTRHSDWLAQLMANFRVIGSIPVMSEKYSRRVFEYPR